MIVVLCQHEDIPYWPLIRKSVGKFLVLYAEGTVAHLVNNFIDRKLFNFVLLKNLILQDESMTFLESFLSMCSNPAFDITIAHPAIFRIVEDISEYERYCSFDRFRNFVDISFMVMLRVCHSQNKRLDSQFLILTHVASAYINITKFHQENRRVITATEVFTLPYFLGSNLYGKFVATFFKPSNQQFLLDLTLRSLEKLKMLPPALCTILIPHAIKVLTPIPPETGHHLWELLVLNLAERSIVVLRCSRYLFRLAEPSRAQVEALVRALEVPRVARLSALKLKNHPCEVRLPP
jgi:hypothetical protein